MKRLAATARGGRSPTTFAFTLGFWFNGVQGTTLNAQLGTDPTPDVLAIAPTSAVREWFKSRPAER